MNTRYSRLTVDTAKQLRHTNLWQELAGEIEYRIGLARTKMETCSKDELKDLQNEVMTYRKVIQIPQDVIDRDESG